jgi:hypothetical protein
VLNISEVAPEVLKFEEKSFRVYVNGKDRTKALHGLSGWCLGDLEDDDEIHVVRFPGGPAVATLPVWAVAAINIGASIAVSFLLRLLLRPPDDAKSDESPTYRFGGLKNQREEGQPIPVIYGRMLAGGQVVNEAINSTVTQSDYSSQLALSEGLVESIGGRFVDTPVNTIPDGSGPGREIPEFKVNGNSAENLVGVKAWTRLGGDAQSPIAAFDTADSTFGVDLLMDGPATSGIDIFNPIIADPFADYVATDAHFAAYGVGFDLTDKEYDFAKLTLSMPEGWARFNPGIEGINHRVLVRYQELDGAGTPITTGGYDGNGWVYLPEQLTVYSNTNSFSVDRPVQFVDPQTAPPPQTLNYYSLKLNGNGSSGDPARPEAPAPNVPYGDGTLIDEITIEGWFAVRDILQSGFGTDSSTIVDHHNGNNGYRLQLALREFEVAPGVQQSYIVPTLRLWNGTASVEVFENRDLGTGIAIGEPGGQVLQNTNAPFWHHFAFSINGLSASSTRVTMYFDGEMTFQQVVPVGVVGSTGGFRIGRNANNTQAAFYGWIDEVWFVGYERTYAEIVSNYNNGFGVYGEVGTSRLPSAGTYGIWHFDENVIGDQTIQDYSLMGNNLDCTGMDALGGDNNEGTIGPYRVLPVPDGALKRSKWRVQAVRNQLFSTNQNVRNEMRLASVTGSIEVGQSFPGIAVLSVEIPAQEQLSSSVPTLSTVVRGVKVPVWDGVDPANPAITQTWSRNPAWVCLDLLTNERYGLGAEFGMDAVDFASLGEWADYCDQKVWDQLDNRITGDSATSPTLVTVTALQYHRDGANPGQDTRYIDRGQIRIFTDGPPPSQWIAGGYVAWTGEVTASGYADHNSPEFGGYEIADVFQQGGGYVTDVYYDRIPEGGPWQDDGFLHTTPGLSGIPYEGLYEGREARHTYDAIHDEAEGAWDAVQRVAAVGRATILIEGSIAKFKVNRARTASGFLNPANITEGTFVVEYGANTTRDNSLTATYVDEKLDYARSSLVVPHSSVSSTADATALRNGSYEGFGFVRRSALWRHLNYLVNLNIDIDRGGSFEASIDAFGYEVGDILRVSNEITKWGQGGRALAASSTQNQLIIDTEITIEAGTYQVDVRNAQTLAFETSGFTLAPGTYPPGTTITLDKALSWIPAKGDLFTIYEVGALIEIEVVNIELRSDLTVRVDWVEYKESVFDDDNFVLDTGSGVSQEPLTIDMIPPPVTELTARQVSRTQNDDSDEALISLSFTASDETARLASHYIIWSKRVAPATAADPISDVWKVIGRIDAGQGSGDTVAVSSPRDGAMMAFAVQPVSHDGQRVRPEACARRAIRITSLGDRPEGPVSFSATQEGDKVVYSVGPHPRSRTCAHEIRRGYSWVTGLPVAVLPPGETKLISTNWAGASANSFGEDAPTLRVRALAPSGRYSPDGLNITQNFGPPEMPVREDKDLTGTLRFYSDQAWEDYGDGWRWITPPADTPNATLSGFVVSTYSDPDLGGTSRPILEFDTGFLDASYTAPALYDAFTAASDAPRSWQPENYHIEVDVEFEQLHPARLQTPDPYWNEAELARLTAQGPIENIEGETPNVTGVLEIRILTRIDDGWSAWGEFKPGVYFGTIFQLRFNMQRQNEDFNVRVKRFHQRFRRVPRTLWQRSPLDYRIS